MLDYNNKNTEDDICMLNDGIFRKPDRYLAPSNSLLVPLDVTCIQNIDRISKKLSSVFSLLKKVKPYCLQEIIVAVYILDKISMPNSGNSRVILTSKNILTAVIASFTIS